MLNVLVFSALRAGQPWARLLQRVPQEPFLAWGVGPFQAQLSKTLAAALAERGIPARWLPLSQRPAWLHHTLSLPWPESPIGTLFRETPFLILTADMPLLQALWQYLTQQKLIHTTYFLPSYVRSPLTAQPTPLTSPTEIEKWKPLYEELAEDFTLVQSWIPCTLIGGWA